MPPALPIQRSRYCFPVNSKASSYVFVIRSLLPELAAYFKSSSCKLSSSMRFPLSFSRSFYSRQVLPRLACNDPGYRYLSKPINFTDFLLSNSSGSIKAAYFRYLCACYLACRAQVSFFSEHAIFFFYKSSCSAFYRHIARIIRRCPQEQMSRIATGRIIAFMAYKKPLGNISINKAVSHSMSIFVLSFKIHRTISSFGSRFNSEFPTKLIRWLDFDFGPESSFVFSIPLFRSHFDRLLRSMIGRQSINYKVP